MTRLVKRKAKGYFVVFEGGEGTGKSTQMRHLMKWLRREKLPSLQTLNPGGTKIGKKIRDLLLDPRNKRFTSRAELLLYEADRAQHVEEVVRPALEAGKVVVCDRFTDSSTVYQGICRGMGEAWTEKLNQFATAGILPDLVIILDLPETEGRKRIKRRIRSDAKLKGVSRMVKLDRLERERSAFHQQVRKGFLKLVKKHPLRLKMVDASMSEPEVAKAIENIIEPRLKRRGLLKSR